MFRVVLGLAVLLTALTATVRAQAPLRAGDSIEIRLAGVPSDAMQEFSAAYTIDSAGNLNLPYIGQLRAAGLLPAQVEKSIESKLKVDKIYSNPNITITTEKGGLFVNVTGEVNNRGRFPYTADMTLMIAINNAGGFSEFAKQSVIRLRREGRETVYDAKKIERNEQEDPKLLPGDQVKVDRGFW